MRDRIPASGGPLMFASLEPLESRRLLSAGQLDPTFGVGGKSSQPALLGSVKMVTQPNGKVLEIGSASTGPASFVFEVGRLNADGSLDTGFGMGGHFADVPVLANGGQPLLTNIALQSDGKFIIGVRGGGQLQVQRFTSSGHPDATFGAAGVATISASVTINTGVVKVLPNGKILAIGAIISSDGNTVLGLAIARFNANGTPDTTFGTGGLLMDTSVGGITPVDAVIASDGGVSILGDLIQPHISNQYHILRYSAAGVRDTTAAFPVPGNVTQLYSVALQSDGKLVLAGTADNTTSTILLRYTPAGAADSTFGAKGIVDEPPTTGFAQEIFRSVYVQPDGKIVAGGSAYTATLESHPLVARYNGDGTPDGTFAAAGRVITTYGGAFEYGNTVAPGPKGTVVEAGGNFGPGGLEVARFTGDAIDLANATISGLIYIDANANGQYDAGEPYLRGQKVYIDTAHGGSYVVGDPVITTSNKGWFTFSGLTSGIYSVGIVPSDTIKVTAPSYKVFTVNLAPSQKAFGLNFGVVKYATPRGTISGAVFVDGNANGRYDAGETFLPGQQVYLDSGHNGVCTAGDPVLTTDIHGWFTFANIAAGNYVVGLVPDANLTVTTPPTKTFRVNLIAGQQRIGYDFGVIGSARVTQGAKTLASAYGAGLLGVSRYNAEGTIDATVGNSIAAPGFTNIASGT